MDQKQVPTAGLVGNRSVTDQHLKHVSSIEKIRAGTESRGSSKTGHQKVKGLNPDVTYLVFRIFKNCKISEN